MSAVAATLAQSSSGSRLRVVKRAAAVILGSILLGAVAGIMAANGDTADVIALMTVFLPVAIWKRPQLGPFVIMMSALLIEAFPANLMAPNGSLMQIPITNSIPLFQGIGSLHVEPADLLLLSVFAIYMIRSAESGTRWWPRSQVSFAVAGVFGAIMFGGVLGLMHHGQIRDSVQEARPLLDLCAAYLLTAVMIRTRSAVQAMLWGLVAAETFKSIQGIYVWTVTHTWPGEQNVLSHEEAMFECLFFFMVMALWMFGLRGRLRTVSTSLVPLVFYCDLLNDRRTSWLILAVGFVVMLAVAYRALPHRRRTITRIALVSVLISAVYFPAFWNDPGTLGKPAEAFRSEFGTPTARDALSDQYRLEEDSNLELNIQQAGLLGEGFGIKINYVYPEPGFASVEAADPLIMYVPHNGVLYILLRMGVIGGVAFWGLIGAAIIAGCRLATCREPQLAAVGAISAAAVAGWVLEGATDQGFVLHRVAFVIGCVIGLAEAARHMYASGPYGRQDRLVESSPSVQKMAAE